MKTEIYAFIIFMSIQFFCSSSASSPDGTRVRIKRTDPSHSKYIYRQHDSETTTQSTISDLCSPSQENESETSQVKRSVEMILSNISTTTQTTTIDYMSILSPEFINCTHTTVEPECYQKLQNGSVYVPRYNMLFDTANYVIQEDLLFVCPDFFKEYIDADKFSWHIETVSTVCVCISTACIILHILMFLSVKRLRNLPGYCLLSLCIALLCAYICSFVQAEITDQHDCMIIGMFLLYFFLSSFFWMNTMSYDVWRSIRMATFKFRLTGDRPKMVRFGLYSLYAWGTPLGIIIISIIAHHTTNDVKYKLIFNISTCWFYYKQALTVYFACPLFVLLGVNIIFFVSSFYMISSATMSKSQSGNQAGSDLWTRLFLSLRLASVMGFMWIFGIIAAVTERVWLWYLYAICNALQGVFIFFSFTVNERTRKACKKAIQGKKFSSAPTQISSNTSQPATSV